MRVGNRLGWLVARLSILGIASVPGCGRPTTLARASGPKVVLASQAERASGRDPEALVKTFVLANRGDADLRLGPVTTSCGCSSAKLGAELIPPGGTAIVTVEGQPPNSGSTPVAIRITTNDTDEPRLTLRWELASRPTIPKLLTPPPAVDLGIMRPGQIPPSRSIVFDILEDREAPPFILGISADQSFCRVTGGLVDDANASDPRFVTRSYRYQVNFVASPEVGKVARQIDLLQSGDHVRPWLTVPVRGTVLPVVRAVPPSVPLAMRRGGTGQSARLMVVCDDQSGSLEVECAARDPATTIRVVRREANRVFFEVAHDAPSAGATIRPIQFSVTQPISTTLDVPVVVTGEP